MPDNPKLVALNRLEANRQAQIAAQRAMEAERFQSSARPFLPRVHRLNPRICNGDVWVVDGRRSERYTNKTWRMCIHYVLALIFG